MNKIVWEQWPVTAVYQDVGEDVAEYAVFYRQQKVIRAKPAGRFDNLYRLVFGPNNSTVVSKTTLLDVGV